MKKTIGAIALAAAFFVLTACGGCEKNEVPMDFQGEVLLNFQIISDIHYNTEYDPAMNEKFRSVCQYNAENFSESDALVVAGDFTVWGTEEQYSDFFGDLTRMNTAKNAIVAMGNHEYEFSPEGRIGAEMFPERSERYRRYVGDLLQGTPLEKTYYDRWINGYHFIVLNSENWVDGSGKAYISEEQLAWFESALQENAEDGKPIFVVCHQPFDNTVDRSWKWGLGAQTERIQEILSNYPQAIVFSGHLHNGYIGYDAVFNAGYGTLIDLPAFQYNDLCNTEQTTALGYNVEVYEKGVVLTPVDYAAGKLLQEKQIVLAPSVTYGANAVRDAACAVLVNGKEEPSLSDGDVSTVVNLKKGDKIMLRAAGETKIAGVRLRTDPKVNFVYGVDNYGAAYTRDSSFENSEWGGCTVNAQRETVGSFSRELPKWGKCFSARFEEQWLKDLGWIFIDAPCSAQEIEVVFSGGSAVSEIALVAEKM